MSELEASLDKSSERREFLVPENFLPDRKEVESWRKRLEVGSAREISPSTNLPKNEWTNRPAFSEHEAGKQEVW